MMNLMLTMTMKQLSEKRKNSEYASGRDDGLAEGLTKGKTLGLAEGKKLGTSRR